MTSSYGTKEKREDRTDGDQITVSRGFKSQRLSDHIGKLVHSSLCSLTWTPGYQILYTNICVEVCVKQSWNCLPWLPVGAFIAIHHRQKKTLISQEGVTLHIWNIGTARKGKSHNKVEIIGERYSTGSLGLLTKDGKQATSLQNYSSGACITWCHCLSGRFNVFSCTKPEIFTGKSQYTTDTISP